MSKKAFEKIRGGLDEAIIIAPYIAEIERLRAENEKLRAALKPFAPFADHANYYESDRDEWPIKIGDLRAAADALKGT